MLTADGLIFHDDIGVQNDGEPVAAAPVEEPAAPVEDPKAEPETEVPAEEPEDDAPKKKTGSQRWRERAQRAAEEADYWRQRALQGAPEVPKAPVMPGAKPDVADYESQEAYLEALAEHKAEQKVKEIEQKREHAAKVAAWQERTDAAREKFEDFDEALESAPAPTSHVADVLMESPVGADLAYYLATHPSDYKRINQLSPVMAARELTLIETKLATPKPEAKKPTQAPKPPAPVGVPPAAPAKTPEKFEVY